MKENNKYKLKPIQIYGINKKAYEYIWIKDTTSQTNNSVLCMDMIIKKNRRSGMSILGFIKDVVLLPVDIVQDVTGIGIIKRVVKDDFKDDIPLDTVKRIKSMGKNWDDTYDDDYMKIRIVKEKGVYRIQEYIWSPWGWPKPRWGYADKAKVFTGNFDTCRDFKTLKEAEDFVENNFITKVIKEYDVEDK